MSYPRTAENRICARVCKRLYDYLDGDLSVRREVEAHLSSCGHCRQELERRRQAERVLVAASANIPQPGDLRAGFYQRLAAEPRPSGRIRWQFAATAVCAALLLMVYARRSPVTLPESARSGSLVKSGSGQQQESMKVALDIGSERGLKVREDRPIAPAPATADAMRKSSPITHAVVLRLRYHRVWAAPPAHPLSLADDLASKHRVPSSAIISSHVSDARNAPISVARATGIESPASDDLDLRVQDSARGFSSHTVIASDSSGAITVDAEDTRNAQDQ